MSPAGVMAQDAPISEPRWQCPEGLRPERCEVAQLVERVLIIGETTLQFLDRWNVENQEFYRNLREERAYTVCTRSFFEGWVSGKTKVVTACDMMDQKFPQNFSISMDELTVAAIKAEIDRTLIEQHFSDTRYIQKYAQQVMTQAMALTNNYSDQVVKILGKRYVEALNFCVVETRGDRLQCEFDARMAALEAQAKLIGPATDQYTEALGQLVDKINQDSLNSLGKEAQCRPGEDCLIIDIQCETANGADGEAEEYCQVTL